MSATRRLGCQSVADRVDVQPVPDFERPRTTARHQAERAEEAAVGCGEQAVLPLLVPVALMWLVAEPAALERRFGRLRVGPGHPRLQVIETLLDRACERFSVVEGEPAQDRVVVEVDAFGWRAGHRTSRTKLCARSTRATRSS